MADVRPQPELSARLRELRVQWNVTQRQLSEALKLSGPLISSWENGTAIPPEQRLRRYALFFATRRSLSQPPAVIPVEALTTAEEEAHAALIDELVRLREAAVAGPEARVPDRGALGGRFWYFADGQDVTILCTPFSRRQVGYTDEAAEAGTLPLAVQYATNPTHPNAVRNLLNGDVDALLELVGHIRAENPTTVVHWMTYDQILDATQLSGHLVILGGGDRGIQQLPAGDVKVVDGLLSAMEVPVVSRTDPADEEFGGFFAVTLDEHGAPDPQGLSEEIYRPRFLRDDSRPDRPLALTRNVPRLTNDVALIARSTNPYNPESSLTLLCGQFSRGTLGAVRAFTDEPFRGRNETWLTSSLDPKNFWILTLVPVLAGESTMTPDLTRGAIRLRTSE